MQFREDLHQHLSNIGFTVRGCNLFSIIFELRLSLRVSLLEMNISVMYNLILDLDLSMPEIEGKLHNYTH